MATNRYEQLAGEICAGQKDGLVLVQALLAMHTRLTAEHQAAVAELVDLNAATFRLLDKVVKAIDTGRSEPLFIVRDLMRNFLADNQPLIAKHRAPDAFETWAEGLIDE